MGKESRVALVLTQRRDTGNWDPAGYVAASNMARRHGFDLTVVEEISFAQAGETFADLARSGHALVIGHGSDYAGPLVETARAAPETLFAVFSYITSTEDLANVAGWSVSWNEVEFLTGAVAGLATREGQIGTVRGVELVPAEFALGNLVKGARHVRPDVKVEVEHISDWNDFEGAEVATRKLVSGGADVIYAAADSADRIVQQTCQELGVLTFGEYLDEGQKFPEAIITSFMVNEARAYDELGDMLSRDAWSQGIRQMDAASGDIRFAPFQNVPDSLQGRFQELYDDVALGRLKVG